MQSDVLIFPRALVPVLSTLHPVLALLDFAIGYALARQAWPLARQAPAPASVQAGLNASGLEKHG